VGVLEIIIGLILLLVLGGLTLIMNPPNAWVHKWTDKDRDKPK
jgi:hypothetical protein